MIMLGLYRELYNDPALPSFFDHISGKECDHKNKLLQYLKKESWITSAAPARMIDVITGEPIAGELTCSHDGVYGWRSDIVYYFEKYNLELPKEFVKYVLLMYCK